MLTSKQCDEVRKAYRERGHSAAGQLCLRLLSEDIHNVATWLARADGELSAIGHGRAIDKEESLKLSAKLREIYE